MSAQRSNVSRQVPRGVFHQLLRHGVAVQGRLLHRRGQLGYGGAWGLPGPREQGVRPG